MSKKLAIYWVDDDPIFKNKLLTTGRGLLTQLLKEYELSFSGEIKNCRIEHEGLDLELLYSEPDLASLWDNYEEHIWLVDWNLENLEDGKYFGDDIVKTIRKGDPSGKIIFYSAEKSQKELMSKVEGVKNIECALRSTVIEHNLSRFLKEKFGK